MIARAAICLIVNYIYPLRYIGGDEVGKCAMKMISVLFIAVLITTAAYTQEYGTGSNPSDHYVNGYYRNNGTYVEPHYQTNPNAYRGDNYETKGNYNYHTGTYGARNGNDE